MRLPVTEALGPVLDMEDGLWLPFGSHWSPVPSPSSLPSLAHPCSQTVWMICFFRFLPFPKQGSRQGKLLYLSTTGSPHRSYSHSHSKCTCSVQKALISTFLFCSLFFFLYSNIHCEVYSYGLIGYLFWLNLWVLFMASHCETHGPALTQPSTQPRLSEAMWPCTKVLGPACAGVSLRLK